jgi:hypothetical protein
MSERMDRERREEVNRRLTRALAGYRERRRHRRGEDTYFGSADCLLPTGGEGPASSGVLQRRDELLAEAESIGMPRDLAERLYEVAHEEGIDPGLGFELVRCGLGVVPPPEGVSTAPEQPSTDRYLPEWIFPAAPPETLLRERMLRLSFRRLRSLLESHADIDEAFRAFATEPDVDHFGY